MQSFNEFVESLRKNGASSVEIEFHPPQVVCEDASEVNVGIFGARLDLAGAKFVRIDFFPPETALPQQQPPPPEAKIFGTVVKSASAPMSDVRPLDVAIAQASAQLPVIKEPAPAIKEPEAAKPAADQKPKRESKKTKSIAAEAPKDEPHLPVATSELPKPADVYDVFVETVEQDDGTKSDVKRALLEKMSLDDMLRVNAGFQLGLDTDVATEDLRAELLTCFI